MSEAWAALQGHVINGVFPLRRYLGSSDHSAVFLTDFAGREPSDVAIKLVPAAQPLAEPQLSRWLIASCLDHPNLLRLLDAAQCQIAGRQYVCAVMEYADQNLGQLLERRALTEDETREMLVPTLKALAFLHARNLAHGQVKPSNILVVGDQLKLAAETIRTIGEARDSTQAMSAYDPPEAKDASYSAAGDIWALGITLCEALTQEQPSSVRDSTGAVWPTSLPIAFRSLIERCLNPRPDARPSVAELEAWLNGEPLAPAPPSVAAQPATTSASDVSPAAAPPDPILIQPAAPAPSVAQTPGAPKVNPAAAVPKAAARQNASSTRRPGIGLVLLCAVLILLAVGWAGLRALRTQSSAPPLATGASASGAAEASRDLGAQIPASLPIPADAAPVVRRSEPPALSPQANEVNGATGALASSTVVHEEIPDVPVRARRTIRGKVRVSVRVIVNRDGTIFAALADRPGPSRYFERLAVDAAKKWTFEAADSDEQRLMLVRFEFSREHTTADAVPLK